MSQFYHKGCFLIDFDPDPDPDPDLCAIIRMAVIAPQSTCIGTIYEKCY